MSNRPTLPAADFVADALAYIEANLWSALSVAAIADIAGLSVFHFSRCFSARMGESVMGHVRTRRMYAAAERLRSAAPPLAQLAFDCGFESQEAFTRAFRKIFGVPPGKYRAGQDQTMLQETVMSDAITIDLQQLEQPAHRAAFTVAGVRARFDDANKSGMPALWPRLLQNLPLAGQVGGHAYGPIWSERPGDDSVNYMAGVEVRGDAPLPAGFERLEIAAQTYLVFRLTLDGGPMHPQVQAAAAQIWGELLPKAGVKLVHAPDFEFYPDDFDPARKGMYMDVYVPIEA